MNIRKSYLTVGFSCIFALSMGCAVEAGSDEIEGTDDNLTTGGITSIELNAANGFMPPNPNKACFAGKGAWKVDFKTKKMTGNACVAGKAVTLNATLSADELKDVIDAVRNVRVTKKGPCLMDGPTNSLVVNRGAKSTSYADEFACFSTPVTRASIAALVGVANRIGAASKGKLDLTGVKKLVVVKSQGFFGPPPGKACLEGFGNWTIDFYNQKLTGNGCYSNKYKSVSVELTNEDVDGLTAKIAALKIVPRPASCPADVGANRLTLTRGNDEEFYASPLNSCAGETVTVNGTELSGLTQYVAALGN